MTAHGQPRIIGGAWSTYSLEMQVIGKELKERTHI